MDLQIRDFTTQSTTPPRVIPFGVSELDSLSRMPSGAVTLLLYKAGFDASSAAVSATLKQTWIRRRVAFLSFGGSDSSFEMLYQRTHGTPRSEELDRVFAGRAHTLDQAKEAWSQARRWAISGYGSDPYTQGHRAEDDFDMLLVLENIDFAQPDPFDLIEWAAQIADQHPHLVVLATQHAGRRKASPHAQLVLGPDEAGRMDLLRGQSVLRQSVTEYDS